MNNSSEYFSVSKTSNKTRSEYYLYHSVGLKVIFSFLWVSVSYTFLHNIKNLMCFKVSSHKVGMDKVTDTWSEPTQLSPA